MRLIRQSQFLHRLSLLFAHAGTLGSVFVNVPSQFEARPLLSSTPNLVVNISQSISSALLLAVGMHTLQCCGHLGCMRTADFGGSQLCA